MAARVTSGDVKAVGAAAGPRNGTGNSFQLIRAALAPVAASCRNHASGFRDETPWEEPAGRCEVDCGQGQTDDAQ